MSCVIGYITKEGTAIVIADTLVTEQNTHTIVKAVSPKLTKIGDVVIGFAGHIWLFTSLIHHEDLRVKQAHESPEEYIYNVIVPILKGLKDKDDLFEMIIAVDGRLFKFSDDMCLLEPATGFAHTGSSADYAAGAIFAMPGKHPWPEKVAIQNIKRAFTIAKSMNSSSNDEVVIMKSFKK